MTKAAGVGYRVLEPDDCWRRLEAHGAKVGRVVLGGPSPDIFPVNYLVDGRTIVFRTAKGKKLSAVTRQERIAFEVDELDPEWRSGWSVVVRGFARPIEEPEEIERLRALPLHTWDPEPKPVFVRLASHIISGREIR